VPGYGGRSSIRNTSAMKNPYEPTTSDSSTECLPVPGVDGDPATVAANDSSHSAGQLIVFSIAGFLVILGATPLILAAFNESFQLSLITSTVFAVFISRSLMQGLPVARFLTVAACLGAIGFFSYGLLTAVNVSKSYATLALCLFVYVGCALSIFHLLFSSKTLAYLAVQNQVRLNRMRVERVQKEEEVRNRPPVHCSTCNKEVVSEDGFRCPLCNWPL
jgi:hypothetical protein